MTTTSKHGFRAKDEDDLDAIIRDYTGPDAGEDDVRSEDPAYVPPVEPVAPVDDAPSLEDLGMPPDAGPEEPLSRSERWWEHDAPPEPLVRPRAAPVEVPNLATRAATSEAEERARAGRRAEGDRSGRDATALYEEYGDDPELMERAGSLYAAPLGEAEPGMADFLSDPLGWEAEPTAPTALGGGRHVAPGIKGGSSKDGGEPPSTNRDAMIAAAERAEDREADTGARPERERWESVVDPWDELAGSSYAANPLANTDAPQAEGEASALADAWYGSDDGVPQTPGEMALAEAEPATLAPNPYELDAAGTEAESPPPYEYGPADDPVIYEYVPDEPGTEAATADMGSDEIPDEMDPAYVFSESADQGYEALPTDPSPEAMAVMSGLDDPEAIERGLATDDLSDEGANITGSEYLPIDVSDEARTMLGMTGPRPGVDTDVVDPWAHSEPDADEMGGPSDGDADDYAEGAGGLDSPWAPDHVADAASAAAKRPGYVSGPDAIDAGLPTEGDVSSTEAGDVIRRIFHGLLSAVAGASGRTPTAFRANAPGVAETRREGIAAREGRKVEFGNETADRAAEVERYDADRMSHEAIAADRLAETARANDIRETLGLRTRDNADARTGYYGQNVESSVAARDAETARTERRGMIDSPETARARALLSSEIDSLRPALRDQLREAVNVDEMSAEEIETYVNDIPGLIRDRMGRGAGGGAGGGGGAGLAALRAEATRLGLAESTAQTMDARGLRDFLDESTGTSAPRAADDFYPGVPNSEVTTTRMSPAETGRVRDGLRIRDAALGAITDLEDIVGGRSGPERIADLGIGSEASATMALLYGAMTELQHSGSMTENEREVISRMVPDPTSVGGWTLDRYNRAIDGWRRALRNSSYTSITGLGVSEDTATRAVRRMGGRMVTRAHPTGTTAEERGEAPVSPTAPAGAAAPEAGGGSVTYRDPETGATETVADNADNRAAAAEMGLEVVDGP